MVLQLDSFAGTRAQLRAQGWKVEKQPLGQLEPGRVRAMAACTLNGHPTWTGAQITYNAYWVEYKNVYGMVLVRKDMGGQIYDSCSWH